MSVVKLLASAGVIGASIVPASAQPASPPTFALSASTTLGVADPAGSAVADFNNDGRLDLIVTQKGAPTGNVKLLTGDGVGGLSHSMAFSFADASAVATADFDGDGFPDVAITQDIVSKSNSGYGDFICGSIVGVAVFPAPGMSSARCLAAVTRAVSVQAGDFDEDGRPDLAVISGNAQGLRIVSGSILVPPYTVTIANVAGANVLANSLAAPVDLNGDGHLDLVAAHAGGVNIYWGTGTATFGQGPFVATGSSHAVAMGDLNGDSLPDIVSVNSTAGQLMVAVATAAGEFVPQILAALAPGLSDVAIADLDRDGALDIAVADRTGGRVRLFYGNGDGVFAAGSPITVGASPKFLAVRDWDGDGDLDIGIVATISGQPALAAIAIQGEPGAPPDTTPPVIVVPGPQSATTTVPTGAAVSFAVSATDTVDGPVTPACVPASGSTFPVGVTTVTCTATDAAGNTGSSSFTVTVTLVDTRAPLIIVPRYVLRPATSAQGATVAFVTWAFDTVDGVLAPICVPSSGAMFPIGFTLVRCWTADAAGNRGAARFWVIVYPPRSAAASPNLPAR